MAQKMIKIGKWDVPTDLFEGYVRLISATERSSERYNYDFDKAREGVHTEIMEYVGLMPHTKEYREFNKSLGTLCEATLPARFPPQRITKIKTPVRGLMSR